ncbi:hypothetical protein [Nonomuraea sp. NPDC049480]|uniref:hypothetical protein n=1 Tax=Nonomuraea sp. NPDC049480 TaxID=3364353 RepID=UPI0037B7F88F
MADPAELAAAPVAIGLLKRSFTAAEPAAEAEAERNCTGWSRSHLGFLSSFQQVKEI